MESRFGRDFSHVRVHTDAKAAASARAVQAQAYTVGSHVVFGEGRFQPSSASGRRLLAHELAHVAQQAEGLVQCTPDPTTQREFDARVATLRAHPGFRAIKAASTRRELTEIISEARRRDNALYYVGKLEQLFDTVELPPTQQAEETAERLATAATEETARIGTSAGGARKGAEEAISQDPSYKLIPRRGRDGTTFLIDARDVTNIAVRIKVRLVPRGSGRAVDVANVSQLEDAIEKRASTLGYSVDVEFVTKPGPDVFTIGVDTSKWPTSGNWVVEPEGLAHEVHHLLKLEDLYDYIERHATNPRMTIAERIHWFRVQMDRTPDPAAGKSIMGKSETGARNLPSDQDVCRVAGLRDADYDSCLEKRAEARRARLQPPISSAFVETFRAFELLSAIRPENPAEDPADVRLKRAQAAHLGRTIFGAPIALSNAADVVGDMRFALALPNLFLVSELSPECARVAFTVSLAPRIRICPAFFDLGLADQTSVLLREAAHFVRVSDGTTDAACASCGDTCGGKNNAEAWGRFVTCVAVI
jgi:hypothetical protein